MLYKTVMRQLLREIDNARGSACDPVALPWLDTLKA